MKPIIYFGLQPQIIALLNTQTAIKEVLKSKHKKRYEESKQPLKMGEKR